MKASENMKANHIESISRNEVKKYESETVRIAEGK
jgi:hypothetical protein